MGRSIRKRQEVADARITRYDETLRSRTPASESFNFEAVFAAVTLGRLHQIIRAPGSFKTKIKSKDQGRLRLVVAKHAFARFPVPYHLERVWFATIPYEQKRQQQIDWFVTVAGGGSLHKEHTSAFFTRKETHAFLTPPVQMSFEEAIWYAVATSYTDNLGICLRVSKLKLSNPASSFHPTPFWKDVVRFFCVNDVASDLANDLIDYLSAKIQEDKTYSVKGRTVTSLTHQMHQWHRDLARAARIGGGSWKGFTEIDDFRYVEKGAKPHLDIRWTIEQIKTGNALAAEGNAMRHCVASYKPKCMRGECSIFSLKKSSTGKTDRALTIEVDSLYRVVQARGYANRKPTDQEAAVLRRWIKHAGLTTTRW